MRRNMWLAALALFVGLTSCQKDDTSSTGTDGPSTLTVTIPQGIETKAAADYVAD